LRTSGGPEVTGFGDPGLVISRIIELPKVRSNGKTLLVRHFSHQSIPLKLPAGMDERSVMMSRLEDIQAFVAELSKYKLVVTSAMHVMITCQSYGIPCALVTFQGYEENVHGTGIKYEDYALGAGVEVVNPTPVPLDLRNYDFAPITKKIKVSEAKKDQVEGHIKLAIEKVLGR
jgi:hypothetical protein